MSDGEMDRELDRLMTLDQLVQSYFSTLAAVEQGAEDDDGTLDRLRDEIDRLTWKYYE